MNDLRKAAEMALGALEDIFGKEKKDVGAINALRQALNDKPWVKTYAGGKPNYCTPEVTPEVTTEVTREVPCKTHPDAPHGFNRNASFDEDRYVCDCEFWEPDVDAVNMTPDRVDETAKGEHELYDQTALELCEKCGWKAIIPDEGCLVCARDKQEPMLPKAISGTSSEAKPRANSTWVGLTDEEIQAERHKLDPTAGWTYDHFARAIEAKLKEKNVPQP